MKISILLAKNRKVNVFYSLATFTFLLLFMYFLWIERSNKCDMEKNLTDLIQVTDSPLLGYIRNNRLPPQDFDVDVVMDPKDYDKIMSLQSEFNSLGYTLYGKNDILPYTLLTDRLNKVSIRIYNDKSHYYLELYDNYYVPQNEIQNILSKYYDVKIPKNYNVSESYVCIGRRHKSTSTEQCHYYKDIYPLKRVKAFPQKLNLYIPNNPHNILTQLYGKDYMIPQAKGYKAIVCYIKPKNSLILITFIYVVVLFVIKLFN